MKKFTIIVGKSASGKTTLANHMVEKYGLKKYRTSTTRPKRDCETENDYEFITNEQFQDRLRNNGFIETKIYNVFNNGKIDTWYYGTPIIDIENDNSNYVIVLTLDGAIEFANYYGKENCEIVYLDCSRSLRQTRAMKRGNFNLDEWTRRLVADDNDFPKDKVRKYCKVYFGSDNVDCLAKKILNIPKVYISGKISGTTDYLERFEKAEMELKSMGWDVINPAKINSFLPTDTTWEEYMEIDYKLMDICDTIYMLKDWESSRGANAELEYAKKRKMNIIYEVNYNVGQWYLYR